MRSASTTRQILSTFYKMIPIKESKRGWKMPFMAEKMRGMTPLADLMDAKSGDVVAKAGEKITARRARELAENGLKEVLVSSEDLAGRYIAEDIVDLESGQIYAEAGAELDAKLLAELKDQKVKEFHVLDIDHVNIGPFIRNTLNIDKNSNGEEALMDIYRVMRPGEPPTIEAATNLFHCAVLRQRALRPLGRRPREDEHAPRARCAGHRCACCAARTSSRSSRRWWTCATAAARSTTSTISATAACARSAS